MSYVRSPDIFAFEYWIVIVTCSFVDCEILLKIYFIFITVFAVRFIVKRILY